MAFETDEVIAATGFMAPLEDLPALGVATFGQSRLPAQTANWESASVPGIFFAGTIGQGARVSRSTASRPTPGPSTGLATTPVPWPPTSPGPVSARSARDRPSPARTLAEFVADELTRGPEIWNQRAYLARIVSLDPTAGILDEGIGSLATFVDEAGPDALAITLESDGSTHVYPVLYSRVGGTLTEHRLDPDPLLDYRTDATRREIDAVLGRFGAGARSGGV